MDRLFDRLNTLIRSLMAEDSTPRSSRPADPDLADAMDELEEFLNTGRDPEPEAPPRRPARPPPRPSLPVDVAQAYKTFEVPPTASMEQLRHSYRRLMRLYHPDKHTGDPEKQRIATEITQKLTESFVKIRDYRAGKRA